MIKNKKNKHSTKKALLKRIKITGTGKLMRSHQFRSGHLRRNKSKRALRRHAEPMAVHKTNIKAFKRLLGI